MARNQLFIISSAIFITSNPLSYTGTRSVFSADERANQTVKTINSIKDKQPGSKIILIESGLKKDLPYDIESMVDKYVYLGDNKMVREVADGPFKGLGEAMSLYLANDEIRSFNADYYFKLSGRYFLNDHFQESKWTADAYTGMAYGGVKGLWTVLYGFPSRLYDNWMNALKEVSSSLTGEALEIVLAENLTKPINYIHGIGASGYVSYSGSLISL